MKSVFSILVLISFLITIPDKLFPSNYSVSLKLINEIKMPSKPMDIIIKDSYAIICCNSGNNSSYLVILDITTPKNLPGIKVFDNLSDNLSLITVSGNFGYINDDIGRINIVNFKDMNFPFVQNWISVFGVINKLFVANGYLYVLKKDIGLQIYDIENSTMPVLRGTQIVSGEPTGIFVDNKYAYITSSTGSLSIIDINNMPALTVSGFYNFGLTFKDVFVNENYAYLPQGSTGIQVLNVSKLPYPQQLTNIFAKRNATQVIVDGYYTWVNDELTLQAYYNKDVANQLWAGSYDNQGAIINKIFLYNSKYVFICSNNNVLRILEISYNY
jgi:hypothetical protein